MFDGGHGEACRRGGRVHGERGGMGNRSYGSYGSYETYGNNGSYGNDGKKSRVGDPTYHF